MVVIEVLGCYFSHQCIENKHIYLYCSNIPNTIYFTSLKPGVSSSLFLCQVRALFYPIVNGSNFYGEALAALVPKELLATFVPKRALAFAKSKHVVSVSFLINNSLILKPTF